MYLAYDDGDHPYLPVLTHSFPTRRSSYLPTPASSSLPVNERTSSSAPSPSPTWTTRRLQNAVQPAGPRSSSIAAPRRSCILAWHQFCSETIGRHWERSTRSTPTPSIGPLLWPPSPSPNCSARLPNRANAPP